MLTIRDARLTTDSAHATGAWTWQGAVIGNAPFRLEVRLPPVAGARGQLRARVAGGQWVALAPGGWATVATGTPGRHTVRLEMTAAGVPPRAAAPEVRATLR